MPDNHLAEGIALFNRARFFDAHEVLEDVWREASKGTATKRHLQGLVQLAVAFHHQSTGNYVGARSVLERALRNLDGGEESFPQIDFKTLRTSLRPWRKYLAETHPGTRTGKHSSLNPVAPELPQVVLHR